MREVLFKNLTSADAHRRSLIMSERVEQGDIVIKTQRRSVYFVKDSLCIKNHSDLSKLKRLDEKLKKRHFYVTKKHDSRTGEDKLFCRIRGSLYVVMGNYLYLVAFINSFKIDVKKLALDEKER